MRSARVDDLPTRGFQGCVPALFVTAYAIASSIDDDSYRFAWHMLDGLTLVVTVLFQAREIGRPWIETGHWTTSASGC